MSWVERSQIPAVRRARTAAPARVGVHPVSALLHVALGGLPERLDAVEVIAERTRGSTNGSPSAEVVVPRVRGRPAEGPGRGGRNGGWPRGRSGGRASCRGGGRARGGRCRRRSRHKDQWRQRDLRGLRWRGGRSAGLGGARGGAGHGTCRLRRAAGGGRHDCDGRQHPQ